MRPLLQRISIALLTGAVSFGLTKLARGSLVSTLTLAVFVAGSVLVVEFLRDVERSMTSTENMISHVNNATRLREAIEGSALDVLPTGSRPVQGLINNVVGFTPPSPILGRLVVSEIRDLTELVQGLTTEIGRRSAYAASCEGEDRNWLLALTGAATGRILATSTTAADGGQGKFEDGFWKTELGRAYLNAQRAAVDRGVEIRRVFILTDPEILASDDFIRTCEKQLKAGIEVRTNEVLSNSPSTRNDWTATFKDFILFDDEVSYEVDLEGIPPTLSIARTNLRYHPVTILDRRTRFEEIWEASTPFRLPQPSPPPDA
ncbi:hypothetical protein; putative signal peptide [Frankia alni ACN14a]|uniref:DUF6879 domain-containing protein n=1 Tax=Frankia alni (strain DSM 45986 / CECT 9034 / ACN14a) TaxID=326424 RepID=Q0RTQ3_FRAAA|nr:hypothetical protein [Frankia sp. AvcI1]CAJ59045.1 hypothetical protein; putative signal peptide [Frankia alni ACN14a]